MCIQRSLNHKKEGAAPYQALRLEESVSALVLAGQEDHMAGFGILPAEALRLGGFGCFLVFKAFRVEGRLGLRAWRLRGFEAKG